MTLTSFYCRYLNITTNFIYFIEDGSTRRKTDIHKKDCIVTIHQNKHRPQRTSYKCIYYFFFVAYLGIIKVIIRNNL